MNWLLSGDYPRSRLLTVLLVLIVLGLALAPFLFPGQSARWKPRRASASSSCW